MLNFNLSADEFWIKLQNLKEKLSEFSHLSLVESQQNKQIFLEEIHLLLSQLAWDSIGGGCYIIKDNKFILSIEFHGLLVEFLLSAGIVFSEGEFIYRGESLVKALNNQLFDQDNHSFINQISFTNENAPFILTTEKIQNKLSPKELILLTALMDYKTLEKNKSYWIKYKSPLNIAAERINVHYKQAQILEHTLREKLTSSSTFDFKNNNSEINIEENTFMISLLTQLIIWHKKTSYSDQLENLVSNIIQHLSECDINEKIFICYALLDYCQINFRKDLIELICETLISLEENKIINEKSRVLVNHSCEILNQLDFLKEVLSEKFHNDHQYPAIKVIQLPQSKIESENQKQKLFSCYDPWLKVYQTHE